jgi:hypothetical protein
LGFFQVGQWTTNNKMMNTNILMTGGGSIVVLQQWLQGVKDGALLGAWGNEPRVKTEMGMATIFFHLSQ